MINPPAGPLYQRIADELRARINAGDYPPGTALPSEAHLRQTYATGQHTIRAALRILAAEGLIVKHAGQLARVRETPPMSVAPIPPGHRVRVRPANDEERAEWDLPPGAPMLVLIETVNRIEAEAYPGDRFELEPGHSDG